MSYKDKIMESWRQVLLCNINKNRRVQLSYVYLSLFVLLIQMLSPALKNLVMSLCFDQVFNSVYSISGYPRRKALEQWKQRLGVDWRARYHSIAKQTNTACLLFVSFPECSPNVVLDYCLRF